MTFDERLPLMKDTLKRKATFDERLPMMGNGQGPFNKNNNTNISAIIEPILINIYS